MLGAFNPLKVVPERSAAVVLTAKAIWPDEIKTLTANLLSARH